MKQSCTAKQPDASAFQKPSGAVRVSPFAIKACSGIYPEIVQRPRERRALVVRVVRVGGHVVNGSIGVVKREYVEDGVDLVGLQLVQLPRAIERLQPEDALSAVEGGDFGVGQLAVRQKRAVARGIGNVG